MREGGSMVSELENIVEPSAVILCLYLERGISQRACVSACSPRVVPGPEGLRKAGWLMRELCGCTP